MLPKFLPHFINAPWELPEIKPQLSEQQKVNLSKVVLEAKARSMGTSVLGIQADPKTYILTDLHVTDRPDENLNMIREMLKPAAPPKQFLLETTENIEVPVKKYIVNPNFWG
jgi:hypothetical protein